MDLIKYYPQADHLLQDQKKEEMTIGLNTMFMNLLFNRYFMRGTTYIRYNRYDTTILNFRNEDKEFCLINEEIHGTFIDEGIMEYNRGHLLSFRSQKMRMKLENDIIVELYLGNEKQDPKKFGYYIVNNKVYLIIKGNQ